MRSGRRVYMSQPKPPPKTNGGLSVWVADVIRHRGILGAIRYYSASAFELLCDLTPQRRRSRYGDIDYDFDHEVDTTWATVSLRTRFRELLSGAQYQASEPELFHEIMRALPILPEGLTFIDLGSGKGRTLLMASDYPFRRIIGVELLKELDRIAQRNILRYRSESQQCHKIESMCGDAREFDFPEDSLVLYLFNPFPDYVLDAVLRNLRQSLEACPRPVHIIYHNLVHEDVFRSQSWLRQLHRTQQFAIYRAGAV